MWVISAVLALLAFAGLQLSFKRLAMGGMSAPSMLLLVFGITTVLLGMHVWAVRGSLAVQPRLYKFVLLAAVLGYLGNLFMVRALAEAPNPGYAMGVIGAQAVFVTLGAIVLFGSEFSLVKGLGIMLTVAGAALLGFDR